MPDKSDGLAPRGEGIGSWITQKWRQADTVLTEDRRNYWLNSAFYEGDQWVFWSPNNEVTEFPRASGRVHAVVNKIQSNLLVNHARLVKRELPFETQPDATDDATVQAARLGDHLLRAEYTDSKWRDVRLTNIQNVDFGGTAAVFVSWNPNLGQPLGMDPETGSVINTGNPELTPASVCEFTLEPGTSDPRDSRWALMCKANTPDQVKAAYNLPTTPDADGTAGIGPLQRKLTSKRTGLAMAKLTLVYTYFERPSNANPDGRHLIVVNSKPIVDEAWPYPFDHLPCYVFRQQTMPKRWTGETYLNQARSLQVQLNAARSLFIETMKMAGNARLAIPDNAGIQADDLTDTPGEVVFYDGSQSGPPQYIAPAQMPSWMFDLEQKLSDNIDDAMFVHGISRGQAPGDRNSGLALSVLAEKDETPLGLMAMDQAAGWGAVASMVLKLWEQNVTEVRKSVVQVAPGAPPIARLWNGNHLKGQTSVKVPLDAVMPSSRAATQAMLTQLAQTFPLLPIWQNIGQVTRLLDLPNADNLIQAVDPDIAKAELEHFLVSTGDIVFPDSFDDHSKHISEHNAWRKSTGYQYAPPDVKRVMDQHVLAHEKLAAEAIMNQDQLAQTAPGLAAGPQDNGINVPPSSKAQSAGIPPNPMSNPNPNQGGKAIPGPVPPPMPPGQAVAV